MIARLRSVKESNLDPNLIAAALGQMVVDPDKVVALKVAIHKMESEADLVDQACRVLIDTPALIEAGSVVL